MSGCARSEDGGQRTEVRGQWTDALTIRESLISNQQLVISNPRSGREAMDIKLLLKGLVLGFAIAAPVGPIGIICIRKSIASGRASGCISGLGAATADGLYMAVAAFGLTGISGLLLGHTELLRTAGGLLLLFLGIKTFLAKPPVQETSAGKNLPGDYLSTFLLTLANPMTILSFAAVFAGFGLGATGAGYFRAAQMVLGVFLGSALWWLFLSQAAGFLGERLNLKFSRLINYLAGIVIVLFALAMFVFRVPG